MRSRTSASSAWFAGSPSACGRFSLNGHERARERTVRLGYPTGYHRGGDPAVTSDELSANPATMTASFTEKRHTVRTGALKR